MATVSILHAIGRGVSHGFELIDATGFPGGTVYPALSRLERDGHVRSDWEDPAIAHGQGRPQRRYYRLTPPGRRLLETELGRLRELSPGALRPARRQR